MTKKPTTIEATTLRRMMTTDLAAYPGGNVRINDGDGEHGYFVTRVSHGMPHADEYARLFALAPKMLAALAAIAGGEKRPDGLASILLGMFGTTAAAVAATAEPIKPVHVTDLARAAEEEAAPLRGRGWETRRPVPQYLAEFPDFEDEDVPEIPSGFRDCSWHNDTCPSWNDERRALTIFIDHEVEAKREVEGHTRYALHLAAEHPSNSTLNSLCIFSTDNWPDLVEAIDTVDNLHINRQRLGIAYFDMHDAQARGDYRQIAFAPYNTEQPITHESGSRQTILRAIVEAHASTERGQS